jgi:hypothetical protein
MPLLSVNSDDFDQAAKTDSDHIEGDL